MTTPLIQVQEVSKHYSGHTALNNVSLEIPQGAIFGLLGPNGAGKTSLIRILNQITMPDSGKVVFNGMELVRDHISKVGYLPEERGLYKKMKVGEQVLYLAQLKGLSRHDAMQKLKYWFEKLEITTWWKKEIEELSKGMQQKVQFITTVIHEPELLILDEPFSGFDPVNAALIKNELLELNKKGTTILLSTHRMESVEELCSHIALIHKSNKILDGSVEQVKNDFRNNTYELIYTDGNSIGVSTALWTGFELISNEPFQGKHKAIIKALGNNGPNNLLSAMLPVVKVESFRELIPSMNDIFIRLVSEN